VTEAPSGDRPRWRLPPDCQTPELAALYERWFGPRTDGCFVEVGAFDGETMSNTVGLADAGWTGLYIEPVPEYAALCRQRHARNPHVTVAECAVGATAGPVELQVRNLISGVSPAHQRAYDVAAWARPAPRERTITVHQLPLDQILEAAAVAPGFELLVVDVEGYEPAVFAGFDLARWRPTMLVVELFDGGADFDAFPALVAEHAALRRALVAAGYDPVHVDAVNSVFVARRGASRGRAGVAPPATAR
jgi:FkbM family methyltransferase